MAWLMLLGAGLCEVLGVLSLKRITDKGGLLSYLYFALAFGTSFTLLSMAMDSIPMGTAYAIWTGIGTAGSTLLGMFVFGEPKDWKRILCICLIISSAVGLKLLT
ncbi:DMT family transporter [Paenibacillus sp. 481]|uniref:DMT family transporter n=1 Tax=Paenibacillus sp. 481 TaxID=2835869 RepID=UPI001E48C4AD|nr:multidrug efflux SMR transporter [Paenibacillus sp. 481]UHA75617.1 multidrug efflux SMR transporter [Paenibacillus sp. 481]